MSFVIIALVFILSVAYVVQPLFGEVALSLADTGELESLELKKRVLLEQIKELEIDFELGNIAESDFSSAREELKVEASETIARLKALVK